MPPHNPLSHFQVRGIVWVLGKRQANFPAAVVLSLAAAVSPPPPQVFSQYSALGRGLLQRKRTAVRRDAAFLEGASPP